MAGKRRCARFLRCLGPGAGDVTAEEKIEKKSLNGIPGAEKSWLFNAVSKGVHDVLHGVFELVIVGLRSGAKTPARASAVASSSREVGL